MNLIGKIFVVLILVMSVVFMSLALAVYATHKNWRDYVIANKSGAPGMEKGVQWQLSEAKDKNKQLLADAEKLKTDMEAEVKAKVADIAKLETEKVLAKQEIDKLHKDLTDTDKERRDAIAAMQATQDINVNLRKENEGLREEIRVAQKDRDANFKQVVALTDDLHQSAVELATVKKRTTELAADLVKAKSVLAFNKLDMNKPLGDVPPTGIDAVVLATQGTDLIEISLGSDDFLAKGHVLYAYRQNGAQNIYLGKVEVIKTEEERSVCKIDPATRKGLIQKGDRVASSLPE
jgi:hypothetical protein